MNKKRALAQSRYGSHEARLDTILGDAGDQWLKIKRANQDFERLGLDNTEFPAWMLDNFGMQLKLTRDGVFMLDFQVCNQQKYTVFLLKYS
jgi:hypothetical protein